MVQALILALKSGLSLWESKESRKYLDQVLKLERKIYEENSEERPDMARLDNLNFQLCIISEAISSDLVKKNP